MKTNNNIMLHSMPCCFQGGIATGKAKNVIVAIKKLGQYSISVSDRNVLRELKVMKSINNENVNAFVGVCFDQSYPCFLMTYRPRGSLNDVLHNNTFNLSWDFKLSLLADIAKGMEYLHGSDIGKSI